MAEPTQSYKNHTRFFPLFHYFVLPLFFLNVINEVRHVYLDPTRHTVWTLVLAIGFVALALSARVMALAVQDRVIRMEMRQRLALCLPPDLRAASMALTPRQLVALRFASDPEMAEIVRDVLAGKIATSKDIKLRVKDWQPDWMRA